MKLPLLFTSIAVLLLLLTFNGATGFTADHAAGAPGGMRMRSRRVEDLISLALDLEEEATAYPHRRVLQAGGHIGYNGLQGSKLACNPCPARGGPYTPGCKNIFMCRG